MMDLNTEFILKGYGSDLSCDFSEPLFIPFETHEARLALKNFTTYNSVPNVEEGVNNQLKIKVSKKDWSVISLATGAYELSTIYDQLVEWIEITYPEMDDVGKEFKLVGNEATSKSEFIFKDDYGIDFDVENSICKLLGFKQSDKFEGKGRYIAENIVNIATVTQFIFNCSVTDTNYINGREMPFLYNCGINVPSGYRISREITDLAYKKLTTSQLSHIRVWIVDQNGARVNLREEELVVTLLLQLKKRITPVSLS